jgi:cytoskeletal protein RodZ
MTSKTLKKIILVNFAVIVCIGLFIFIKSSGFTKIVPPSGSEVITENTDNSTKEAENNSDEKTSGTSVPASTDTTSASSTFPTSTTTASSSPTVDTRCIVTVSGNKYDVTVYRTQHSGGDIFKCGTDMTSIFFGQHSSGKLSQMSKYLVK